MKFLRLLDFAFDDSLVSEQETCMGTLAMFVDLQLVGVFNIEYQVRTAHNSGR